MEEEYKRLLAEIRDAYFLIQGAKISLVSSEAALEYGYGKDELIGKRFIELIAPERRNNVVQFQRSLLKGAQATLRYETVILTKEGTRVPVEISAWPTYYRGRPAVGGIAVDITERDKRSAELVRVQEEERRRLAQALHDDTIQELLLVTHRLKDIGDGTYGRLPAAARGQLEAARALVERTINEVRGFTQDLRPAILDDLGLVPALRWLTDRLTTSDGVQAQVRIIGVERRLPPEIELALFRVVQETLSNVRRHAAATTAMVALVFGQQKVKMSVRDNGRGFEPPLMASQFAPQGKLGLSGIVERVRLLGGSHKIESAPGKGTNVQVEISV